MARHLAAAAARILERVTPDLVAVTGGDTAYALIRALRPRRFDLTGAPADGLALGRLVRDDGRALAAAHQGGRVRGRRPPRHDPGRNPVTTARVPVLGITMGDPAGVGPEIIAKALAHPEVTAACRPVVIGDRSVMAATLALLRSPLTLHAVKSVAECTFEPGRLECLDLGERGLRHAAQVHRERRGGARRLRLHRDRRAALPGRRDRRHRDRARQQGGARRRGRPAFGAHRDPGAAHRHEGLRDAPDGQGAQGHPRDHPRGPPPRAGPGDARAGAAASSAWRSRP